MKGIRQLQEADLHQCLQHKIGEQFRAMYANETNRKLPARLLDLLRDFEQVEVRSGRSQVVLKKAMDGGHLTPFEWRRS
jgi:hypothetical protein